MNNNNYYYAVMSLVGKSKTLLPVSSKLALSSSFVCAKNTPQSVSADISSRFSPLNILSIFITFFFHLISLTKRLITAFMKILAAVTQYYKE